MTTQAGTAVDPHRARRRTYKGISFGTTLICVGVVLLLNTTGQLAWGVWYDLARLWPLLLISLGLRLIFVNTFAHLLCLAGPAMVVAATVWATTTYDVTAASPSRDMSAAATMDIDCPWEAKEGSQRFDLNFAAGELNLVTQARPAMQPSTPSTGATRPVSGLSGTLRYTGREPRHTCDGSGGLRLSQARYAGGFQFITPFADRNRHWEANLTAAAPIIIDADLAAVWADLDLRAARLSGMTLDCAAAKITMHLGPPAGRVSVRVHGAAANLDLSVPAGTCFTISRDRVLSTLDVEAATTTSDRGRRVVADVCGQMSDDTPRYEFRFDMPVSNISVETEGLAT